MRDALKRDFRPGRPNIRLVRVTAVEPRTVQGAGRAELMLAAAAIQEIAASPGRSDLAGSVSAVLLDVAAGMRRAAMLRPTSAGMRDA